MHPYATGQGGSDRLFQARPVRKSAPLTIRSHGAWRGWRRPALRPSGTTDPLSRWYRQDEKGPRGKVKRDP